MHTPCQRDAMFRNERKDERGLWDKRSLSRPIPNPRWKITVARNKGIDEIAEHLKTKAQDSSFVSV